VYVFDVEQTEGKELPSLTDVRGDVAGFRERLIEYVESQGITLSYSEKIAPAKGLSSGKRITLLTGMQPSNGSGATVTPRGKPVFSISWPPIRATSPSGNSCVMQQ